ncbi:MAG: PGF-CTERM sorting domain-containing protein [Candidatus Methanoperedens sp.]|nr:PGF-CTERM sorting domain-containing protein [Candidatus Methanoperedens sp.]
MNSKRLAGLLLVSIVILTAAPTTFARPEYLTNLTEIYGTGSCDTCHLSGASGGPRTAYGTSFESQPNYATDPKTALLNIGAPAGATVTIGTTTTAATPGTTAGTPATGFGAGTATATVTGTVSRTATATPASGFGTGTATGTVAVTTATATPASGFGTGTTTETATAGTTTGITTTTPTSGTTARTTPRSPGFGIVVSLVGLFAWAILGRRKNK